MEHSLAMKRKILLLAIKCMDFEGIMLTEISQIENTSISFLHVESLRKNKLAN